MIQFLFTLEKTRAAASYQHKIIKTWDAMRLIFSLVPNPSPSRGRERKREDKVGLDGYP
jgi:hypothetical protein